LNCEKGSGKYLSRELYGFPFERIHVLDQQRELRQIPIDRTTKEENINDKYSNL
jgi:hypothetical protein